MTRVKGVQKMLRHWNRPVKTAERFLLYALESGLASIRPSAAPKAVLLPITVERPLSCRTPYAWARLERG